MNKLYYTSLPWLPERSQKKIDLIATNEIDNSPCWMESGARQLFCFVLARRELFKVFIIIGPFHQS